MKITRRQLKRMISEVTERDKDDPAMLITYLVMMSAQGNEAGVREHRDLLRGLGYDNLAIGNIVEMALFLPSGQEAINEAIRRWNNK